MAEHTQHTQRTQHRPFPLYTPAGFALLRAPALSARIFSRLSTAGHLSLDDLEAAGENLEHALRTGQEECTQVLWELAVQPQIAQALAVASSSLHHGLERVLQGDGSPAQQKRIGAAVLRYLIRMSTRPTPFGRFSGVACCTFAGETQAQLALPVLARFRTRPDMHWLLSLLRRIEEDRDLVAQLRVRLNQTAYLVGERVVLPFADTYGEQDQRAITLRATSVVRKVFELAQQLTPYAELQRALQDAFPQATPEQVGRVLWQLWENHFLLSELHPPLTSAHPAQYVRDAIAQLQGIDEITTRLAQVLESASALDHAGIGAPLSLISNLVQQQQELVPPQEQDRLPLQVDSALHVQAPMLHQSVAQAAARAAEFLLRQTPLPTGFPNLHEYRMRFLETYGEQVEVPLLDLLSPENGLDAPAGYERPPRVVARPSTIRPSTGENRDQVLLDLVTEAVNRRSLEVELTEELQQRLERWSPTVETAPLSLEIYLQLHASSRQAIDRGEWTAVVGRNCGSFHAGRTFGRFFDLLEEPALEQWRCLVAREEALCPDVIFAEVSYQPLQARLANVTTRPPLRSYEIVVGTTPSVPASHVLLLSDLVVGVRQGRFYVRSLRLGKQVRVCQTHMLNVQLAPNVCRFLMEIANDGVPALSPFDWGAAASAAFLPRVVLRIGEAARLVISLACWQVQAETIVPSGEGSEEARWFRGLQRFRALWRVPRYVYLVDADNRLLLDLENPLMVAELRHEVRRQKNQQRVSLEEVLPDFEHLWLRDTLDAGYFSEIVVPLLRTEAVAPAAQHESKADAFVPPPRLITPSERKRFPGEDWVYLKLFAAPSQHEAVLAGPLRELVHQVQMHELIDRWFFIRYADPEPHLRLRLHARDAESSQPLLEQVLPWSLQLARRGQLQRFSLETYEREVERYGGPEAIDVLEQVFTVDSVLVSDMLAAQYARRLTLDPLAVAVFTLDHFFAAWGCDFRQRMQWTHQMSEKYSWSNEFRALRKHYADLLAPRGAVEPAQAEQRKLLLDLVRPYEPFLRDSGTQVRQLGATGTLWVSETSLFSSLAHMHLNRLLGIDRTRETQVYAFWRHTLDTVERRPREQLAHE